MSSELLTEKDKLYLAFPSITEQSDNFFVWFLHENECRYMIEMMLPEFPTTNNMTINVINQKDLQLPAPTNNAELVIAYLSRVKDFLKEQPCISEDVQTSSKEKLALIKDIRKQFRIVELENFTHFISNDYKVIKISRVVDGVTQFMEIVSESDGYHVTKHSLPPSFSTPDMFRPSRNFETLVQSLTFYTQQLDQFYTNMQTIDQCCNVVEPVNVTEKDTFRMLKLCHRVFMKFDVDPRTLLLTAVEFLGPTNRVENFRTLYDENVEHWDSESDIYTNLLKVLGMSYMPFKSDENDDCNICLSFRSDSGHIPYVTCENDMCNGMFHLECIKQWFDNLRSSKTFLSVIVGACPLCKAKLPASFASMLDKKV